MNTNAIDAILTAKGYKHPSTKVHHVKSEHHYFDAVVWGPKTAELRKDDRGYEQGDLLAQYEIDDDKQWTGRVIVHRITHLISWEDGPWLAYGHVMLSLSREPVLVQDYVERRLKI